jgi:hypothetical protein
VIGLPYTQREEKEDGVCGEIAFQIYWLKDEVFHLSLFALAATTKYHSLIGLNRRDLLSHSSEDWKSMIKMSAGLMFGEGSFFELQVGHQPY